MSNKRTATGSKETKMIAWNASDFLTSGPKKRKSQSGDGKAKKRNKAESNGHSADAAWRGRLTISLKSSASVAAEQKEKKEKPKSDIVAESLSTTVGDADHLVVFGESMLGSHFLTAEEASAFEDRQKKFEKKHGEKPTVFKLQWRDRDGASLLGMRPVGTGGGDFAVESNKTEPQKCTAAKKEALWLGAASSLEKIALKTAKGEQFLCIVPQYKGVARLSVQGVGSGANALRIVAL